MLSSHGDNKAEYVCSMSGAVRMLLQTDDEPTSMTEIVKIA
jgi:hypothetical protein